MATLKQFEANRRNSQKSTGPKTPDGKSAVSMNALRHGLRARSVLLPGEDRNEFNQRVRSWIGGAIRIPGRRKAASPNSRARAASPFPGSRDSQPTSNIQNPTSRPV